MPPRMSSGDSEPDLKASPSSGTCLDSLPDELLIQIFGHLAEVGSIWEEEDPHRLTCLPYRQPDLEVLPPTGLRGYPFLAQVCRKWRRLLATRSAQELVWRHVCVDLGHELVTAIHTPLRWSNQRPSAAEYQEAFENTSISAGKVLRFLGSVAPYTRSLAVANSEGFQAEEGEYVSLTEKHNFGPGHLGFALALMRDSLTELVLYRCDDLVSGASGVWSLVAQLPSLRVLALEGLRSLVSVSQAACLSDLRKLESLTITGEDYRNDWVAGLEGVPPCWSAITTLTRLELRCHPLLPDLPGWLPQLAGLRHLDVSGCTEMSLGLLPRLTQLQVLVLQHLHLGHELPSPAEVAAAASTSTAATRDARPARRVVPDLQPLAPSLRTLSLSANCFTQLPAWLPRLTRLEHLDMAFNTALHIRSPLSPLAALPHLALLDFRRVHVVKDEKYWCEAKCTTMQHLCGLKKALKRRYPTPRVLFDLP